MRAVIQKVCRTGVAAADSPDVAFAEIDEGLCVLLGVGADDGADDVRYIADKIAGLRIFEDDEGKMNRSVLEVGGAVLLVSQFTLYGDARRGRRPSFSSAAVPDVAEGLYLQVAQLLREQGVAVAEGRFRTHMLVSLCNDGPVTILLDSKKMF